MTPDKFLEIWEFGLSGIVLLVLNHEGFIPYCKISWNACCSKSDDLLTTKTQKCDLIIQISRINANPIQHLIPFNLKRIVNSFINLFKTKYISTPNLKGKVNPTKACAGGSNTENVLSLNKTAILPRLQELNYQQWWLGLWTDLTVVVRCRGAGGCVSNSGLWTDLKERGR